MVEVDFAISGSATRCRPSPVCENGQIRLVELVVFRQIGKWDTRVSIRIYGQILAVEVIEQTSSAMRSMNDDAPGRAAKRTVVLERNVSSPVGSSSTR